MRILFVLLLITQSLLTFGQGNDPVLFSVDNDEVRLSEFRYIYEKNNADEADYSKQSVEEYLELYKKFKLKVRRAKEIGLDTVQALQEELAGYRKQLAKSYLKDKEISERIINEVAERMKTDVEVSHIFVSAPLKSGAQKQQMAEQKINDIYDKLKSNDGKFFVDMAKTLSEDKATSVRGGMLGYYTSPLPDGFYDLENAIYTTEVGKVSKPVRSKMGFHIVKVSDKRPARGQMEIAHILVRSGKLRTDEQASILIDSVYGLLQDGRNYENMAGKFSDDDKTKTKGGYLGFFGINQYEGPFEDAAFALKNDKEYSKPIKTKIGYHIIKRLSKRDDSDEVRVKKRIEARIRNNDRFKIAEKKLIDDVKEEAGYKEDKLAFKRFSTALDSDFYSYKWQPPTYENNLELFNLGGKSYTLADFAVYTKKNIRERLKFSKNKPVQEAAEELYQKYISDQVMAYEEENLERKYPDFKSLMREYSEGILLFEITKQEVWDKASQDTTGLKNFYASTPKKYNWPDRYKVYKYNIESPETQKIVSMHKFAIKKDHQKFAEKYKEDKEAKLTFTEELIDQESEEIKNLTEENDKVTQLVLNPPPAHFYRIMKTVPPSPKTLDEAKGYIIADYQDHLEKNWISDLESKYKVKIDNKVLKSIIK